MRRTLLSTLIAAGALAAGLFAAAAPVSGARDQAWYYYAAGAPVRFTQARFHAAVVTPTPQERERLEKALTAAFGSIAGYLEVPRRGLTIVGLPAGEYPLDLAAVLAANGLGTLPAFSARYAGGGEAWPTVVLPELRVRFVDAQAAADRLADLADRKVQVVWQKPGHDYLLRAPTAEDALAEAAALYEGGRVVFAHPDLLIKLRRNLVPNDTYYTYQWHHPLIGSAAAWDLTTGATSILISIQDDGVDLGHPDLRVEGTGYDIIGDGYSPDYNASPGTSADGHGTSCAGLAAARGNNAVGVSGVCPQCTVLPVRVLPSEGQYAQALEIEYAFDWSRAQGADIISNSWGYSQPVQYNLYPDALRAAVTACVNAGIPVLFAAGNDNATLTCPSGVPWEPNADPQAITIGASDDNDVRMDYSSYGDSAGRCPLTVVAPAASVTTDIVGSGGYNSYYLGSTSYTDMFGGTSAATPVTAGAVGLMLALDSTLTPGQIKTTLKASADKIGSVTYGNYAGSEYGGSNRYYGWGRLNVYRALDLIDGGEVCVPVAEVYGSAECSNTVDDDCDGLVDAEDPSCQPATVAVGAACSGSCGTSGLSCYASWPDGYCWEYCEGGTSCSIGAACWTCWCDTGPGLQAGCDCDPDYCPDNDSAQCDEDSANQGYASPCDPDCNMCMDVCFNDLECRSGYVCDYLWSFEIKVCYPGCGHYGCDPGETCGGDGRCQHDGPIPAGGPCDDDLDCADDGWCQTPPEFPNGYCTPECPQMSCAAGSACVPFTGFNLCMDICETADDCRSGYGCWYGFATGAGICWPACDSGSCGAGEVCCPRYDACMPTDQCTCLCDTGASCQTGCACDEDCLCACDTGAGCQANCACDPDCAACTCDTGAHCQSGCSCDPDCVTCACDLGTGCQPNCACDADCGGACTCDVDYYCSPNCACDEECPCACDQYYGCDEDCDCDYECRDAKDGCSCASGEASTANGLLVGLAFVLLVVSRRHRSRSGRPGHPRPARGAGAG